MFVGVWVDGVSSRVSTHYKSHLVAILDILIILCKDDFKAPNAVSGYVLAISMFHVV